MPAILQNPISYINDSQAIQKIGFQSIKKKRESCNIYQPWYDTSSASNTKLQLRKNILNNEEQDFLFKVFIADIPKLLIGNLTLELPNELSEMASVIKESQKILNLQEDWDSEGALIVPQFIWERAANILFIYSKWIWENKGIILLAPSVDAIADGSIDIMWNSPNARLLLNVKNTIITEAHYYGDTYNGKNKFKGVLGDLNEVQEFFAYWLTNFIK